MSAIENTDVEAEVIKQPLSTVRDRKRFEMAYALSAAHIE